jgi:hypothetical protein
VDVYAETVVTRGLPSNMSQQTNYLEKLYSDFKDANDPLQSRFSLETALPLPDSYPRLFTSRVDQDGLITPPSALNEPAKSIPIMTCFSSGSELKATVDQQLKNIEKIAYNDFYEYTQGESGLSRDDFLEAKEALISLSDAYRTDDDSMML